MLYPWVFWSLEEVNVISCGGHWYVCESLRCLMLFLFYRWGNGGTEKLSDLATVTSWGGPGKAWRELALGLHPAHGVTLPPSLGEKVSYKVRAICLPRMCIALLPHWVGTVSVQNLE